MNTDEKAARTLGWMAWTTVIIGALLLVLNVSDFRSENFPLMVSIGFLIAGVNMFIMNIVFRLMTLQKREV